MVQPLWRPIWQFLIKLDKQLPGRSALVLLGTYPRERKTHVPTKTNAWMFTAALFMIFKICPQPDVLWQVAGETDCETATPWNTTQQEKQFLIQATTWMNLQIIKLSGKAHPRRFRTVQFHLYNTLKCKILEMEGQMRGLQRGGERRGEVGVSIKGMVTGMEMFPVLAGSVSKSWLWHYIVL